MVNMSVPEEFYFTMIYPNPNDLFLPVPVIKYNVAVSH